jgi:GTP-binding protein LepA
MRKETAKGLRKEGRDILAEVGELLSRPLSACGDLRTFAVFFLARMKVQRWLFPSSITALGSAFTFGCQTAGPDAKHPHMSDLNLIRNFSIIAHIDHGKSTLSDRLIQLCGNVSDREMKEQILDSMEIERERGITIKAQTVRLDYRHTDGKTYQLNLMDTPGHVDFAYEVSRSLAACEGAVLVVDASQGVEAQTLANVYQALDNNLEILPVLNKVDLPAADADRVRQQIEEVIGLDASHAIPISAKTGNNVKAVLEGIVERLPPPKGDGKAPLKALLIDSWYDAYLGVVVLVRIIDGALKKGQKVRLMASGGSYQIERVGIFRPKQEMLSELGPGEVGFFTAAIKQVADTRVGDTITDERAPTSTPLPGFKPAQPVVFCGLFPVDAAQFEDLREAMARLRLNDASFTYETESSAALGFGFRCGFLGLLHLEIITERLEREFNLELITTAPSVIYHIYLNDGTRIEMHNPADMPDEVRIDHIEEPWIEATILVPDDHLGAVLKLCQDRRGRQKNLTYVGTRAMLTFDRPLNEVVFDVYDRLKSISRGYASFDYQIRGYETGDLVKMSILVNAEPVDALSVIVHRARAESRGRAMCEKLKELIPPHLFQIPIQAALGGRIIARETIRALRKDVLAKCYGGDITRKRKLLEKQKKGKKRMRQFGQVEIPQEAFIAALKMEEN